MTANADRPHKDYIERQLATNRAEGASEIDFLLAIREMAVAPKPDPALIGPDFQWEPETPAEKQRKAEFLAEIDQQIKERRNA